MGSVASRLEFNQPPRLYSPAFDGAGDHVGAYVYPPPWRFEGGVFLDGATHRYSVLLAPFGGLSFAGSLGLSDLSQYFLLPLFSRYLDRFRRRGGLGGGL